MSATFLSNVYKRFFLFPPTFFTFLSFFDLNVYHLYAELNLAIPPCYRDSEDTESVVVVTGASLTAGFIRVWITLPPKRCTPTWRTLDVYAEMCSSWKLDWSTKYMQVYTEAPL